MSIAGSRARVRGRRAVRAVGGGILRGLRGRRGLRVRRRRRRRGISATELRGWGKVNRLISNAVMILPHGRRGMRIPRRRRRLLGDPGDGE